MLRLWASLVLKWVTFLVLASVAFSIVPLCETSVILTFVWVVVLDRLCIVIASLLSFD